MSERDVVERTEFPITGDILRRDLKRIGVKRGMVLFVQSSLSAIGWVCGGPMTVIDSLLGVLGDDGTLVMPCMSSDWSDPSKWENPPVPKEWWGTIRDKMPAFDKERCPIRCGMGIVAEAFRKWPNVSRSDHPTSIAALGKHAKYITSIQPWSFPLAEGSPLERCMQLGGYGLLIGTTRNTTLHLSEHLARFDKRVITNGAPILESGKRVWKEYQEYDDYTDHFPKILEEFSGTRSCKRSKIGYAMSHLFRQSDIVEFGRAWFERELG
ncbi:MAG: AAC(3) family N-acetyltransferase [Candidatus Methanofastidiosa archaeon]|nr:AAC(3) family N-acetyltransferase [Candidatus Methanofastidiosa archaeon]